MITGGFVYRLNQMAAVGQAVNMSGAQFLAVVDWCGNAGCGDR